MRLLNRNKLKRFLLALTILLYVPLNYAQISRTDSLEKTKTTNETKIQPVTTNKERTNNTSDSIKVKKDSVDNSRWLENEFIIKQKPLSNI
nr:hypothetical protein [uncultured Carboxylicivirga sp.]